MKTMSPEAAIDTIEMRALNAGDVEIVSVLRTAVKRYRKRTRENNRMRKLLHMVNASLHEGNELRCGSFFHGKINSLVAELEG